MSEASVETLWGGDPRSPYMTRVTLGRLRLHLFHRGDADPDCHDHPADFITFPLVSYVEQYLDASGAAQERVVKAFRFHHRRAEFAHRVVGPVGDARGQIATIVWWGRKRREWGFHTVRGWMAWREYFSAQELQEFVPE